MEAISLPNPCDDLDRFRNYIEGSCSGRRESELKAVLKFLKELNDLSQRDLERLHKQ